MFLITQRSTGQPLGMVTAPTPRDLFEGMAALADEAGLDINELVAEDINSPLRLGVDHGSERALAVT